MIGLSSILVDTVGSVVFQELPKSKLNDSSRRISRTKTLDGGCIIVDGGFSESDRTFDILTEYNEDKYNIIQHLHEDKTLINVIINKNFYTGSISFFKDTGEIIQITILTKEKLNE